MTDLEFIESLAREAGRIQLSRLKSALAIERKRHDTDLITQSMDQSNVLPKLRSAIPAGPVAARTEGAL